MKMRFFLLSFLWLAWTVLPVAAQSMTDQQVLEFVQQGMAQGKDQRVLVAELARRGVNRQQVERVKQLYERMVGQPAHEMRKQDAAQSRLREVVPADEVVNKEADATALKEEVEEADGGHGKDRIFGRNIFNSKNLTFEPSVNLATPANYRLGPGDEVIIDIWGTSQHLVRQPISPDGTIHLEKVGPVHLSGMTVAEAAAHLKRVLSPIYSGLGEEGDSHLQVTLGNTRTIQVNVMGEVMQPGTYALSSFSTVFHALYRAGGVNDIGSLRRVQLVRQGRQVAEIDVYAFIMKGKVQDDIRLQEGDVVIVPAYEALVEVGGNVKRPMKFEMKSGEVMAQLIQYFGGFTADAYTRSLRVISQNGEEYEVNTVRDTDFAVYALRNGDVVTVDPILKRFTNKLEVRGAVFRPGIYQLDGKVNTVRSLVEEAEGLMGDAFTNRAVLQRERENLTTEIISINIRGIMAGTEPDVALQKNDVLFVPSIHDLQDRGDVWIGGEVAQPGSYAFSDNMTLEDLIIRAGGLKEAASTARVDVSRRIKDPKSTAYSDSIGRLFSFALKDGFVVEGEQGFVLQPYDQVSVRRSPGYQVQQNVVIKGEVLFSGTYAMTHREERLSDLLQKAGGATPKAYLRGAKLIRKANEAEKKRMEDVLKAMNSQFGAKMTDSLGIKVDSTFTVGINLEAAVANPGGSEDLVLREGDVLSVPVLDNTVKINGAVMMPNTVAYKKGANVNYYLEQAGGYGLNAKKSKKFIIYMNGKIARVSGRDKREVEPGCEIFVPSKSKKRTSVGEVLGYASSLGSLATMFATITNLIKN